MRLPEGSIKRHSDGKRWFVRVRVTQNGRRISRTRICPTYTLAKAALQEILSTCADLKIERPTFRDLVNFYRREYVQAAKFVAGRKISGFRQDTRIIENYLARAVEFFGDKLVSEISYNDLREYKRHVESIPARGRARSIADVNHHLKQVRRLLNIAIEQDWLAVNPFARGSSLVSASFETERTRVLTRDEEDRLLAACEDPHRRHLAPLIIFAIETGCRRGEILALRWADVNLSGRVIRIEAANTKTLRSRLVPITERLRRVLVELQAGHSRLTSRVFPVGDTKRSFSTARNLAGMPEIHFHDLRHTAITRMLERGVSPAIVMKISGHTQQKTFLRYVNQTEQSVYDIALQLDRAA